MTKRARPGQHELAALCLGKRLLFWIEDHIFVLWLLVGALMLLYFMTG